MFTGIQVAWKLFGHAQKMIYPEIQNHFRSNLKVTSRRDISGSRVVHIKYTEFLSLLLASTAAWTTCLFVRNVTEAEDASDNWKNARSVYDFTVNDIHGNPVSLEKYRGNVLLIVNVASKCGLTASNYRELVELHNRYDSKGLRILAFPCNQFSSQEPGTNEDIICFAKNKNAHFDFFDKIKVNGDDACPLWKYLKKEQGGTLGDMIKWNFTKFIVDRNGRVVERHGPTTSPLSLSSSLEKYL